MQHFLITVLSFALLLLSVAVPSLAALSIAGSKIDTGVVFGDSLSDTGNLFRSTGYPRAPYYNGRFSNGPVWIEYLANSTGIQIEANFAVGGAKTDDGRTSSSSLPGTQGSGFFVPGLESQARDFLNKTNTTVANRAVFVWIGGNDYLDALGSDTLSFDLENVSTIIVGNIVEVVNQIDGKAAAIVVIGLPDLSTLPFVSLAGAAGGTIRTLLTSTLSATTTTHNTKLAASLQALNGTKSIVKYVNVVSDQIVKELQSNFKVTNTSCSHKSAEPAPLHQVPSRVPESREYNVGPLNQSLQ
ncbi:hypothetical protein HDU93_008900 [Gonapodya sp. JEL0774]|nr:hypothetical protein HDU93_008900 [Gonapodya sp. JEL0774]